MKSPLRPGSIAVAKQARLQTLYHELRRKVLVFLMQNVRIVLDFYTKGLQITCILGLGKNHLMFFCFCFNWDCLFLPWGQSSERVLHKH